MSSRRERTPLPGLQELTLQAAFFAISQRSSSTTSCWSPPTSFPSSSPSDDSAISIYFQVIHEPFAKIILIYLLDEKRKKLANITNPKETESISIYFQDLLMLDSIRISFGHFVKQVSRLEDYKGNSFSVSSLC